MYADGADASPILEKHVYEFVRNASDRYIDYLQQLLRIPTERMQEHEAVAFVANSLRRTGCDVEVFEGKGLGEPLPAGKPLNVFALRKGKGTGKNLLLGAHVDTIPTGDPGAWHTAPWSGEIVKNRIYARGAHDDRSGVALIGMLMDLLHELGISTGGDIGILVTTEEEFSAGGMQAYLERPVKFLPDGYIMVDGNRRDQCIVAHAAALGFEITFPGSFGSAQFRSIVHDANAIELAAHFVLRLIDFEKRVRNKLQTLGVDSRWPSPTIAVTEIATVGGWITNVPECCWIRGFCNVIPPLTVAQFKIEFEQELEDISSQHTWMRQHKPTLTWGLLDVPAMMTSQESDLFRHLQAAHEKSFGTKLIPRYIGGWGDPRLLNCAETIFYGPGGGGGAHTYDEYYELDDIAPMLVSLASLVISWCGVM